MSDHPPTSEAVIEHPEHIHGYTLHHRRLHPSAGEGWLKYQREIGLRHTRAKKNLTDHADSLNHIPSL